MTGPDDPAPRVTLEAAGEDGPPHEGDAALMALGDRLRAAGFEPGELTRHIAVREVRRGDRIDFAFSARTPTGARLLQEDERVAVPPVTLPAFGFAPGPPAGPVIDGTAEEVEPAADPPEDRRAKYERELRRGLDAFGRHFNLTDTSVHLKLEVREVEGRLAVSAEPLTRSGKWLYEQWRDHLAKAIEQTGEGIAIAARPAEEE